jgi:hypothetical protein
VTCMKQKMHTKFLYKNLNKGDNLEDLDVDGRIVLGLTLEKYGVKCGPGQSNSG